MFWASPSSVLFCVVLMKPRRIRRWNEILIDSTSSSSRIEKQRSRDLIEPLLHNQYLLNDFVSPPPFHPPPPSLYTDLLYFVFSKTLESLKSRSMAMKRNGKSLASSGSDEEVMFFKDVSLGPHETQLRFRLIHFWEARNPVKKTLIGLEMLLIDEQVHRFFQK